MQEIWKKISDYPNYEVSNLGRVRSIDRIDSLGRKKKGQILKPQYDGRRLYLHVCLSREGKCITKNIHRLVAEAFIKNPYNLKEVNHKDEDKTNNKASNLEWCDHIYNNRYGSKPSKSRGLNNPMNKFDKSVIDYIKKNHILCGGSMRNKDLAKMFNISPTHVCAIAHGRRWNDANSV